MQERSFDEAVAWARSQNLNDRRIIRRVEGFITQGWASPNPNDQQRIRETAIAAVAEARTRGSKPRTKRTGSNRARFL